MSAWLEVGVGRRCLGVGDGAIDCSGALLGVDGGPGTCGGRGVLDRLRLVTGSVADFCIVDGGVRLDGSRTTRTWARMSIRYCFEPKRIRIYLYMHLGSIGCWVSALVCAGAVGSGRQDAITTCVAS